MKEEYIMGSVIPINPINIVKANRNVSIYNLVDIIDARLSGSHIDDFEIDSDIGHLKIIPVIPDTIGAILHPVKVFKEENVISIIIAIPKRVKKLIRIRAVEGMIAALYLSETGTEPDRAVVDALTISYIEEIDETEMELQYIFGMLKMENLSFFERLDKTRVAILRESVINRLNDAAALLNLAYYLQHVTRFYIEDADDEFEEDLRTVLSVSDIINSIRG
jgi:hypothetical protein